MSAGIEFSAIAYTFSAESSSPVPRHPTVPDLRRIRCRIAMANPPKMPEAAPEQQPFVGSCPFFAGRLGARRPGDDGQARISARTCAATLRPSASGL
jgi:hypothetical protein